MAGRIIALVILAWVALVPTAAAQHTVARQWNDALLDAIRVDFARPTVHARNLFHTSIAMYDGWAAYDDVAQTYLLGKTVHGFRCPYYPMPMPADIEAARNETISYAMFRLLHHRFRNSPGAATSLPEIDDLMTQLGYDPSFTSTDYSGGSPAALGNYIAQCLIDYGHQDGSNEQGGYANLYYEPINPPFAPTAPGNSTIVDMNRWQPLTLNFIDQSGNPIPVSTPPFLSPEWGRVHAFALTRDDLTIYERDGFEYWVYHDPGAPPHVDTQAVGGESEEYKWGFEMVSVWQGHLDPTDGVMWDISPASIGNVQSYPQTLAEYHDFYDFYEGGDTGQGYTVNPRTGLPYEPQFVPRGDYARVLAEFWADGPDSETPPGHWFTILNYVNDHPDFAVKRWRGVGDPMDELEWDVKAYLTLAGAVHDAAVSAWGIKGWYDYIRPVSAIRAMCERGQSSDGGLPRFSAAGIQLVPGRIEMVLDGDPLAGDQNQNVGRIKLWTWRGHDYIDDPETDNAGVGWILADYWWPYQRPTFITPPFAGYISGHSTFSRAAAEVMTLITGDEYFPGGMGEFLAPMNEFLVFEDGPSMDVTLQWATYRDASDQTSLSRIWGGIHPPADDIPGRWIGSVIGPAAVTLAEKYFEGERAGLDSPPATLSRIYPNPAVSNAPFYVELNRTSSQVRMELYSLSGQRVRTQSAVTNQNQRFVKVDIADVDPGIYFLRVEGDGWSSSHKVAIVQ